MAVITFSRQYGSGGNEIAVRVSEQLEYRFFDKELIAQAASEEGILHGEKVDISEDNYKMRGFFDRLFNWPRMVAQVGTRIEDKTGAVAEEIRILNEVESINLVRGAIEAVYEHGDVVIVGRGGQAILKDKPGVLHVRIEAPLGARVERLHERENYSLGGAQDAAIKRDRAAADYLKRFYDIDWSDPLLYDLVINTGKLNTGAAVQLILEAVKRLPAS
jgi:cytidylate kinase